MSNDTLINHEGNQFIEKFIFIHRGHQKKYHQFPDVNQMSKKYIFTMLPQLPCCGIFLLCGVKVNIRIFPGLIMKCLLVIAALVGLSVAQDGFSCCSTEDRNEMQTVWGEIWSAQFTGRRAQVALSVFEE
jgi:hypothetical protein